jgi:Restriction Enzyme Adenine Methylase Associated
MAEGLLSLIISGKLPSGTVLDHQGREYSAKATVTENGLNVRGRIYETPTGAARAVNGNREVDGWLFWKLPSGKPLDTLRTERPNA